MPTPPANPPAPQGAPTPQAGQPGDGQQLVQMTQDRFDQLWTERLDRAKQSWQQEQKQAEAERNKALAAALGITDPNATPDPAKLLEQAQQQAQASRDMAVNATAQSLALAAGIKPERVETFVAIAKQAGLFNNVDLSDANARTALKAAVEAKVNEFPEWKGSALPPSSGGDGQGGTNPTLTERIAAAESAGDWKTSIALKRQRAREQAGG